MYPPRMLYEIARRQQAEDIARAEAWRRRHSAPRIRPARVCREQAKSARRRLARLAAALANGGRH